MSVTATLARAVLISKLQAAIANIRSERAALETTSAPLPVLTVFSQNDGPSPNEDGKNQSRYRFRRQLVAELKIAMSDDYETQLESYLSAMRASLFVMQREFPLSGHALDVASGEARFLIPEPESRTASLQLSIYFDYLERV